MTVRSRETSIPTTPAGTTPRQRDWSMMLIGIAVWMIIIPFGGLFFAVNGGYSIIGLGVIANAFNESGQYIWVALNSVTFPVPVKVPGLAPTQPLILWCGVVATSILQVVVFWRKLTRRYTPAWVLLLVSVVSIYDLATTFFGFGTIAWVQAVGVIVQGAIAILITFGLEGTISFLLRKV
jgi:hypothetical protein